MKDHSAERERLEKAAVKEKEKEEVVQMEPTREDEWDMFMEKVSLVCLFCVGVRL